MKKNRRRSHRDFEPVSAPPAAPEEEPEPDPVTTMAKSRRRSLRDQEPPPASPEADERPAVGALSGQLPPGTVREAGVIATEAGHYLRRAARDDAPSRLGTPPGLGTPAGLGTSAGEIDGSARRVWEIAFGLAARRRFEPDTALAEISRTVATAVHEHAAAALPMLAAEMLVRAALGEPVPTDEIDADVLVAVHLLLFASLTDELALGDAELDAMIAEAERSADLVAA